MAGWDDDDEPDDDELTLTPDDEPAEGWDAPEIPQTWDEWWNFDWESYDGDYEEYAVSADYNGE